MKFHSNPSSMNGRYVEFKVLEKNILCFIMGYLCAMEYVLHYFDWCIFCMIHNIGTINVCSDLEINLFKIDEFRKYAKIVYYLSQDAKTVTLTFFLFCVTQTGYDVLEYPCEAS